MNNPWIALPKLAPFVLTEDKEIIESSNQRAKEPSKMIHMSVLPEPFLGNPNAPVVVLNLNPGYKVENETEHKNPVFSQITRDNLLHKNTGDYPLYFLSPQLPSRGRQWWTRKLKDLIEEAGLENVAQNLFVAEFFPYHSEKKPTKQTLKVKSREYTFELVKNAIKRNALIIYFRSWNLWEEAIPELKSYAWAKRVRNPQSPAISEGNLPGCFSDIVEAVKRG